MERISDFLAFEGVWWKKTDIGIEFLDKHAPEDIPKPKVHHFRSAGISNVMADLDKHWNAVLETEKCIPLAQLWKGGEKEHAKSTYTQIF